MRVVYRLSDTAAQAGRENVTCSTRKPKLPGASLPQTLHTPVSRAARSV